MRLLVLSALTVLLSLPAAHAQDAPAARVLTIDDLFRMQRVGDPKVSPDGAWVAYTVRSTDLDDESSETRLWMTRLDGGDPLPMTMPGTSASRPQWSPDGTYLSFLASRNDGETQVWALDRRGGEAQPLTDVEQGVSDYAWSPDADPLRIHLAPPQRGTDTGQRHAVRGRHLRRLDHPSCRGR